MEFRTADTFYAGLNRLTNQEQKAVKIAVFDLQANPSSPGHSFHKLDRARDPNFWSVRASRDIRLIVHRTDAGLLIAYVGHHDDAYKWAERRKIEAHPKTGAMQLVEIRERVEEMESVKQEAVQEMETAAPKAKPLLFDNLRKLELMAFGVPEEWVETVRQADEDALFEIIPHLPEEAQEALLKLAVGEKPEPPVAASAEAGPFDHPDARRRFRLVSNSEELERAFDYPWEKWAVFLHPDQAQYVERDWSGPVRISGSAGTGKTVVALHRAVHLARTRPEARVLLTTFSKALANALKVKLKHMAGNEPAILERITVQSITGVAYDLFSDLYGQPNIAPHSLVSTLLAEAAEKAEGGNFSMPFLIGEWSEVVDAWQIGNWEEYRDVSRLGRKTRIGGKKREALWAIFEKVKAGLAKRKVVTWSDVFGRLTAHYGAIEARPFDIAVVDEAQDIGVAEARFLAMLVSPTPDGLFFAGDLGQRIFQQPFSWKSLGIDIRGRSHTLQINYRTSHQIRAHADRLLPSEISDVDGNTESRKGTISVFDGPPPEIRKFGSAAEESEAVGSWLADRLKEGCLPHEIGVSVRTRKQLKRARAAIKAAGASGIELSDKVEAETGKVSISTMHLAKGLEFRAVAVMACDDDILPSQDRIETVTDESDLEEVYTTERHLLYVACTRARDRLLISGVNPVSEFLDDLVQ